MPKRVFKYHLDRSAKSRRKSIACGDASEFHDNNETVSNHANDQEQEDQVEQGNKKKYKKYNRNDEIERLLKHNSKTLYYHVNHSEFPSFNIGQWPQEDNTLLSTYPSCSFSVPRPIYVADKQCEKVDLCHKRVMNMEFHKSRLSFTRTSYQSSIKKNKVIRTSEKDGIYHASVYDMAERVFLNPDPYFHGSYDYYYTGGNLSVLPQSGNIIHVEGEKLRTSVISEFPPVEDYTVSSSLLNIAKQEIPEESEIFEVRPLLTSPDSSRQNCFIARQRNLVSLNYLNDSRQLKTITQFRTKSTPFISFAQSERNINNFLITTMKQHVRLYDLSLSVPKLVKLYELSQGKSNILWNTIKPWRENTFLYANEKQLLLIDTRTTPDQWMDTVTSAIDESICDHISAILPSDFNNLFYVATNHKLQCMDIRHLKKLSFNDSQGVVCRWLHQLRYAPLMMDKFRLRQREYVALASPLAGDIHICQLSRQRNEEKLVLEPSFIVPKHIYSSTCLPYQPPTLIEAYENARLAGKCLQPEANLEARLKCCTTGLTFCNSSLNDSEYSIALLLTSNSNGDIFAQSLSKREKVEKEIRCESSSDNMMAEFATNICAKTQPALNYTEIKKMRSMRKILLCKGLSTVSKYDVDEMADEYSDTEMPTAINNPNTQQTTTNSPLAAPPRKRRHLGRWQKSLSTLHSYKDALVADLLSIWDIDVEEEKNIRLSHLQSNLNIKPDPDAKVNEWIRANVTPQLPPMITIPAQQIAKYSGNTTRTQDMENNFEITQTQNTTIDFSNAACSTQIMENTFNDVSLGQFDTSGFELQIHTDQTATVIEKLKTKKKSKKYVKGF